MTRQQYNVAHHHNGMMIRVTFALFFGLALLLPAQAGGPAGTGDHTAGTGDDTDSGATGGPYSSLLPRRATVSLEIAKSDAAPGGRLVELPQRLQDELRKAGVETTATQPESRVRVTLSEDARGLLFVAEVSTGENRQVAMLPWNLPARRNRNRASHSLRKLLLTQPEPILDILIVDSGSEMLVLSARQLVSYRSMGDKWTPSATASLVLPRPMPRDHAGGWKRPLEDLRPSCRSPPARAPGIPNSS
jgi:hypothetical protein